MVVRSSGVAGRGELGAGTRGRGEGCGRERGRKGEGEEGQGKKRKKRIREREGKRGRGGLFANFKRRWRELFAKARKEKRVAAKR